VEGIRRAGAVHGGIGERAEELQLLDDRAGPAVADDPRERVLVVAYAIGAGGVAVAFGAMPKLIADAVEPTETGVATGMNTVVRTVGSAIGAQVAVTLLAAQTIAGTALPAESGFTTSLWLAAGASVVAAVMALAISPRRAVRRAAAASAAERGTQ
jgi:hypothetical protein